MIADALRSKGDCFTSTYVLRVHLCLVFRLDI